MLHNVTTMEAAANRFRAYPAYSESGIVWIGEIPAHWQTVKLKYIANLKSGETITADSIHEEATYPVYGGNGLRGNTSSYTHEGHFVLIGRQGALCGNINYAFGKFWASEHAIVVKASPQTPVKWLGELLRAMNLNQYSQSAAQPGIAVERLQNLIIPVPPLPEQRAIAAFLDHETARLDALIAKKQRLIELLQEQRSALISHAVTKGLNPDAPLKDSGIEWFGEIPAHWEVVRIKHTASSLQTGPFGSQLHSEEYISGGIPVINPSHIKDGYIVADDEVTVDGLTAHRLSRHQLEEGDIVFARRGEMGRCGLVTKEQVGWLCGTGSIRVRLRTYNCFPHFINMALSLRAVKEYLEIVSVGTTMDNLNTQIIGEIFLPIPPLTEQIEIATYVYDELDQLNRLSIATQQTMDMLNEYRAALISAVVTGKIDVRGEVVS